MFISIIIPTYNRSKMLKVTLDSFINQDYGSDNFEIIIANNNSNDDTQDIINRYCKKYSFIKTVFVEQQGVHYARNIASKISKGEILYFTDDDMIADKKLLSEISKIFELDNMIATVTGLILPKFEIEPEEWVYKNLINGWLSLTDKNKKEDLIISSENCGIYSCHQAIRKDIFFKTGGFNPENTKGIWIGDGETGLNIKIKEMGYKFAFTRKSIIFHVIPKERTTKEYIIKRVSNQAYCDAYTNYRKHRNIKKTKIEIYKNLSILLPNKISHLSKLVEKDLISPYFLPAFTQYYINKFNYECELVENEEFRKIVEIDDWIDNNDIISTKLLKRDQ